MFRLLRDEAFAYVRLGLLSPQRARIRAVREGRAKAGVLFVPGVGANGAQFLGMRRALENDADWFDAYEYASLSDPRRLARELGDYVESLSDHVDALVVVGHSLGGLLLRMVLQSTARVDHVVGYAAICAPLNGTWRSKLAPSPNLRMLRPDSPMIGQVLATADRLRRLDGRVLTIAARRDQFIAPHDSALLDGAEQLVLEDRAHVAGLFDPRVHAAVRGLVQRSTASDPGETL